MKTIGMIGGTSWESTRESYTAINRIVRQKLGGNNSAKIVIVSLNLQEIENLMNKGDWSSIENIVIDAALKIESFGADGLIICTNTLHNMDRSIQSAINIPLIHIGEATAKKAEQMNMSKVALLGTKFTMEGNFISGKFKEKGIEVIVPNRNKDLELINKVIFNELCQGRVEESSKATLIEITDGLKRRGAEGIVLACTELPMILDEKEVGIPVFDTMMIQAEAAAEFILN